jgi:hypothetical protein
MIEPTITDLFGNNPSNNSLFIIINSNNINNLLIKIAKQTNTSIWNYNRIKIDELLKQRNLNPQYYLSLGHIIYTPLYQPTQIILVNKIITKPVVSFEQKLPYGNGFIYKPLSQFSNYTSIGYYYSENKFFDTSIIGLINEKGTIPFSPLYTDKNPTNLTLNNFNLFKTINDQNITLNKSYYLNKNSTFSLLNHNGNYLTNNDNKAKMETNLSSSKQDISYNTQGELIIDGKCLTNIEGNSYTNDEYSDDSEWDVNMSNINIDPNNYEYKGKTVVLVNSNNPWYINTDITSIEKNLYNNDFQSIENNKLPLFANFNSEELILDLKKSNELKMNFNNIEKFGNINDNNSIIYNNYLIIILIFLIIIILVGYRKYSQL